MHKHTDIADTDLDHTLAAGLELVDLDDLRAAFGGEGLSAGTSAQAAAQQPIPSTVMCPSW